MKPIVPINPKDLKTILLNLEKIIRGMKEKDTIIASVIVCGEQFPNNLKKSFSAASRLYILDKIVKDPRSNPYKKRHKSNPKIILIHEDLIDLIAKFPIYSFGKINRREFFKTLKKRSLAE